MIPTARVEIIRYSILVPISINRSSSAEGAYPSQANQSTVRLIGWALRSCHVHIRSVIEVMMFLGERRLTAILVYW